MERATDNLIRDVIDLADRRVGTNRRNVSHGNRADLVNIVAIHACRLTQVNNIRQDNLLHIILQQGLDELDAIRPCRDAIDNDTAVQNDLCRRRLQERIRHIERKDKAQLVRPASAQLDGIVILIELRQTLVCTRRNSLVRNSLVRQVVRYRRRSKGKAGRQTVLYEKEEKVALNCRIVIHQRSQRSVHASRIIVVDNTTVAPVQVVLTQTQFGKRVVAAPSIQCT